MSAPGATSPAVTRAVAVATAALLATTGAACRAPEAGIELTVSSNPSLGIDSLEVRISSATATAVDPVTVPDPPRDLAAEESVGLLLRNAGLIGVEVSLTVTGLAETTPLARGDTSVTTTDGAVVDAAVVLAALAVCGDGVVAPPEGCDDGNDADGDGCLASCAVQAAWSCAGSPSVCQLCGDGLVQGNEQCDDGSFAAGDGCAGACSLELGWACTGEPSVCAPVCGDGRLRAGEACDDGNGTPADGCSAGCAAEPGFLCDRAEPTTCTPICGDALLVAGEPCDDGDQVAGDGCSATCAAEVGWLCSGVPSSCVTDCGDGLVAGDEQCDDGLANDDAAPGACRTSCLPPACGDGVADPGDACDDGNIDNGDACRTDCRLPSCGDGILQGTEQCDDGNTADADGCSAVCVVEASTRCFGDPSVCAPVAQSAVVDPGGGGDFTTLAAALAAADAGDTIFLVAGTHAGPVTVTDNLTIVGAPGALLDTAVATDTLLVENGVTVTVQGLAVRNASTRSAVRVNNSGTVATFVGCTLGPSGRYGIESSGGTNVVVQRTVVADNAQGGLNLDAQFTVENSALVRNGAAGAVFGAADFKEAGAFRFNTVAHNVANANGAVRCQQQMALESSIIVDNGGAPLSSQCDATGSLMTDPSFDADGVHLSRLSPARDAGPTTGCPSQDLDRDPRPLGLACALGADERP